MLSVCWLLLIAKIYKLDSKAKDIVPAFSQTDLDVDICMYLPVGFQVDGHTKAKSEQNIFKLMFGSSWL